MNVPQPAEIESAVTDYILETLLRGKWGDALTPSANLFTSGLVDSLGAMKLIAWLEKTYQTKIPPADLVPDNFQTIEIIAAYLTQRLAAPDAAPQVTRRAVQPESD